MSERRKQNCAHPGCERAGVFKVEDENWAEHTTERINSP
jgi:hypothetical protein